MSDISWLKERFAKAGRVVGIDRVQSGSPGTFDLRLGGNVRDLRSISAIIELVRRGVSVNVAKPAIEAVMDYGHAEITLPMVEDEAALIADLAREGIAATPVRATSAVPEAAAARG